MLTASIPLSQLSASAATTHAAVTSAAREQARLADIRLTALRWAEHQAGKWYCWGGNGPSCYDCSGLVVAAYHAAGVTLPRSTYGMLDSSVLREVPARDRKPGDLAFYGSGHVELVTASGTFGALDYGTQIGWHEPSEWWYPTMYFEVK
jgi:peptidoglycan DL-endopeptidase CwlO